MKTLINILIVAALFCSCSAIGEEEPGNVAVPLSSNVMRMIVVDADFNDRLNPESPGYFGEEYIKGIELFTLNTEGELIPYDDDYEFATIFPPKRWTEGHGYINEGSRGYYFLYCPACIRFPDGSEYRQKVEFYENEAILFDKYIGKLWINDELVYEAGYFWVKAPYFNPKYFPFMKPLLDGNGNQFCEIPDFGIPLTLTLIK